MDRASDALIGAAAADVAAHGVIDVRVGRMRVFAEQHSGRHDLARLAVSALRDILLDPRALQRMAEVGGETFDGGDFFAGRA